MVLWLGTLVLCQSMLQDCAGASGPCFTAAGYTCPHHRRVYLG